MKSASNRVLSGIPLLLPFLGFLFVVSGALGLWFVQEPLSQPQELRSDASVEDGQVQLVSLTNTSQDLRYVGRNITVGLGLNTANTPVKEVSLVFNIITDTTDEIELVAEEIAGVETTSELEATADGFLAEVTLLPTGNYFSTNFNQKILELHFTPETEGAFELNFDQEESVAINYNTSEDTLNRIAVFQYNVIEESETEATTRSCDQTCTANADCEAGYRCFEVGSASRCRLAVNPSSSSCDAEDDSEKSRCNQACEADWNCQEGLSCYEGACRNPKNLTSASCAAPAASTGSTDNENDETEEIDVQNCNESCSSNSDCDINFRCYQGACRLAVNPSSSSCSAATEKKVSDRYEQPGGGAATGSAQATGSAETATDSAAAAPSEPEPSPENTPAPTPVPQEETALDTFFNAVSEPFRRLPVAVIGFGILLLSLGGAAYLFMIRFGKNKPPKPPAANPAAAPPTRPPAQPPTQPAARPPTTQPAPQPAAPVQPTQRIQQPKTETEAANPPSSAPASNGSSMVNRLKNKGITPPAGSKPKASGGDNTTGNN